MNLVVLSTIILIASAKIPDDSQTIQQLLDETVKDQTTEQPQPIATDGPCQQVDTERFCFKNGTAGCKAIEKIFVCCNITKISQIPDNVNHIHIINASMTVLDLSQLHLAENIASMSITDGNVTKIVGSLHVHVKCLNFSNNNLSDIQDDSFLVVKNQTIIDLSFNNLTKLPNLNGTTVDILGNTKISCINISAALERNVTFLNKEKSLCESEIVYWFNDTASITVSDVEKRFNLELACPEKCRCKPGHMQYTNIDENKNDHLIFISDVDCSNSGLRKLPTMLPENTYYLNITNNSIDSLSALVTNDYYLSIKSLFADDNLITSIVDLEGSKFLENFTVLSLRNNKIKDIPYYILSNLEKNLNGKILYLGGNRLTCECHIIKNIRHWRLINDCDKILCNNMQAKILELKESELCKSGIDDWANYIEYVIVIEVILLIALFTKVSYDYYVFKKTGFLPYPASFIILYNQK